MTADEIDDLAAIQAATRAAFARARATIMVWEPAPPPGVRVDVLPARHRKGEQP